MKIIEGKCQIEECTSTKLVKGEFFTYCLTNYHQQLSNPKDRENIKKLIHSCLTKVTEGSS